MRATAVRFKAVVASGLLLAAALLSPLGAGAQEPPVGTNNATTGATNNATAGGAETNNATTGASTNNATAGTTGGATVAGVEVGTNNGTAGASTNNATAGTTGGATVAGAEAGTNAAPPAATNGAGSMGGSAPVVPPGRAAAPTSVAVSAPLGTAAAPPVSAAGSAPAASVAGAGSLASTPLGGGAGEDGWETTRGKIRAVVLGLGLVTPWVFIALVALLKRRKRPLWRPLANRSIAGATLLLVLEVLGVVLLAVLGEAGVLWGWDALYLVLGPYSFGVLVWVLGVIDAERELASRDMIRRWSIRGGLAVLGLGIVNGVLALLSGSLLVGTIPVWQIAAPISVALVGVGLSVFLIRLWRTGDDAAAAAPKQLPGGAAAAKAAEPEKKAEPPKAAEPAKKAEPRAEAPKAAEPAKKVEAPKAAEPARPVEPAKKAEPKAAPKAPGGKKAIEEMSDEELGALFEAMDGGGSGGKGAASEPVPEDRADLYRLLGQLDEDDKKR